MDFKIGVEIDNRRIVWINDSIGPKSGQIRLTTVSENQRKAIIKFYIKAAEKKNLLCLEEVTGIPLMPAGAPSIDITASTEGKIFQYKIYLNGKTFSSNTCKIGKYTRSFKPFLIIAIIAAIFAVAAAIFLMCPLTKTSSPDMKKPPTVNIREKINTSEKLPEPARTTINSEKTVTAPIEEQTLKTTTPITETTPTLTEPLPVEPVFIESEITDRQSVYFQPDSAVLTNEAITELASFVGKLPKRRDFEEGQFKVEVRGHCAKYGTEEGRAELSKERAVTVYNFLKSEWDLEADSVISGAGASEPVTLKRDEQYLNRRVDINIKGNIKRIETTD